MTIPGPGNREFFFSDAPEIEFTRLTPRQQARRLGQYFTPYQVARFMARWVSLHPSLEKLLDPAAGLGVFFRAFLEANPGFSGTFYGYDVDENVLAKLGELFTPPAGWKTNFKLRNFLLSDKNEQFDGILCNPPYIRYKAILDRDGLLAQFKRVYGLSVSRLANIYVYFILRCVHALAPGGRAAILVPPEFLYSGYGAPIKEFLLASKSLKYVVQFDANTSLFADSITTSCILLIAKNEVVSPVTFLSLRSMEDLDLFGKDIESLENSSVPLAITAPTSLKPAEKWIIYVNNSPDLKKYRHLVPFTRIGKVLRGIASGDNRFFTFNREKIELSGIPGEYFLPCLTRSSQARGLFFTQDDFDLLERSGKPVYLLDARLGASHPLVQAYLRQGEATGSHLRYLTRNRNPWYRLENRPPAPILATTFSRGRLRFIRNEAGVFNLTCFHSIYLRADLEAKTDLLMSYLLTPLAHSLIRTNRREYGDGLVKYEPNDLNSAWVANLAEVPASLETEILNIYSKYRQSYLDGFANPIFVEELDRIYQDWMRV